MNQTSQTAPAKDDPTDFLDLLVVVAKSWKLIVIGTSLVAMLAAVILFMMPPVYESFSSLPLPPRVRVTLDSSIVLDPVISANNLATRFGGDMDEARDSLRRKIKIEELVKDSGFYRIAVQGDTPAEAKALAVSYLAQVLLRLKPAGSEAQKIQDKIAAARNAIAELQKLSEHSLAGSSNQPTGAYGPAKTAEDWYPRLLSIPIEIANRQDDIQALQHELDGPGMEDVLQQPNLPVKPVERNRLSRLLGVCGAAFVGLIFFASLRDTFRKLREDPERAQKLGRIRDALGWRK